MKVLIVLLTLVSQIALANTRETAMTEPHLLEGMRQLPTKVIDSKPEPMTDQLRQALSSRANPVDRLNEEFKNLEF